jgi:uncharacterized protein YdhG (YjbR/CyaY superfamily)
MDKVAATVDDYISSFPETIQKKLTEMRKIIRAAAPDAEETISYQMPAFRLKGIVVYFGGFKDHLSFFPTGSGIEAFQKELGPYITGKGTARFALDQPLPFDLITKIVKYRVSENLKRDKEKIQNKKKYP